MKIDKNKIKKPKKVDKKTNKQIGKKVVIDDGFEVEVERPEYKNKKYKYEQGVHRYKTIVSCKVCNGNPETEEFTLSTMSGTRCKECFEVVKYKLD